MYYVAARWRLGLNTWTPWHWVSSVNGEPLCHDPTWAPSVKRRVDSTPTVVNCEKCKEDKIYVQSVQDYERLLQEIGTKKSGAKDASSLVNIASFLSSKHSVPFNTVYGLLFLRDFA